MFLNQYQSNFNSKGYINSDKYGINKGPAYNFSTTTFLSSVAPFSLITYEKFSKFNKLTWSKKQTNSKQEWFKQHNEYLQTDQWKAIRLKVLKRDNNLCQCCLEAPATEVHHLSYVHWKDEWMHELMSVCYNCHHNKIHNK